MKLFVTGMEVKSAQSRPVENPPEGYNWGYDPQSDQWNLIKKATELNLSYWAVARHNYAPQKQDITVGSNVYSRATKDIGKVIRIIDSIYRIQQQNDCIISCFRQELELLPDQL